MGAHQPTFTSLEGPIQGDFGWIRIKHRPLFHGLRGMWTCWDGFTQFTWNLAGRCEWQMPWRSHITWGWPSKKTWGIYKPGIFRPERNRVWFTSWGTILSIFGMVFFCWVYWILNFHFWPSEFEALFFWPQQKSLWRTIVSMNLLVKEVSQAAKQPALVLKWQTAWRSDRILEFHMLTHTHTHINCYVTMENHHVYWENSL